MGARTLAELCRQIETQTLGGDIPDACASLLVELEHEYARVDHCVAQSWQPPKSRSIKVQLDPLVLIADDDPTMRLLASSTLGNANFRVVLASDGQQALELFEQERPDLVLLDVDMPGLSGFQVCRRIRELADASDVPIVMMTGRDDVAAINAAYDSGATDFLAKPVQWALLPHRARYALRGARASEDLREAQARNNAILDAIPDMIFTLDGNGQYIDCRAGMHDVAVLPSEQPVGRNVSELLPPDLAERFRLGIRCALDEGNDADSALLAPADRA